MSVQKGGEHEENHDEAEEEALSLCELPIEDAAQDISKVEEFVDCNAPHEFLCTLTQPADFFEFFNSNQCNSDMCPADDIIVSGKLLPLKDKYRTVTDSHIDVSPIDGGPENQQRPAARCRRSESLSELKSTSCSRSIKARVVRSSRSLDDRRHRFSHSSLGSEFDRNSSMKSDRSSLNSPKVPRSRWQLLIFGNGMVKLPPEMEMRDIKSRQSRSNNPATLFPSTPKSRVKSPVRGNAGGGGRGSTWGLIKALSCKDHTSISVTTSFVCMPHI